MKYNQKTAHALYKKLLALYPRAFKEQLGESMQQTFNDLYKERQTEGGLFGFVLWTFIETAIGIVREHVLLITEGTTMKNMLANPRLAAVISFILCLPAAIIILFDVIDVNPNFWPPPLEPGVVVIGALLLLPVALIVSGAPIGLSAIISLLLVLPFAILEFVFNILNKPSALNPKNLAGLTFLFGLMWLLPTVFIAILMPILQNVRAGSNILANPIGLLLKVVFLALIAMMWGGILIDQLPCFLGVPNCD
jgi:hypothetical protein